MSYCDEHGTSDYCAECYAEPLIKRIAQLEAALAESLCPKCKGSGNIYETFKTGIHYQDGEPMYDRKRKNCPKCAERKAMLSEQQDKGEGDD